MTIKTTSDEELRQLIFEKDRVIVKFIDDNCEICKQMAPIFESFSKEPQYKDITFLKMKASENPVSSKEVQLTGTPFFAIYYKGTLMECGLLSKEEEVKQMLIRLMLQK